MVTVPTLPNKYVIAVGGLILSLGMAYFYGYYQGTLRDTRTREKALVRLVEAEKALAKVAIKKATDDTQRLTQAVSRGAELQREYEDAKPHEVDSVNCVSDDQRRVLIAASKAASSEPGM